MNGAYAYFSSVPTGFCDFSSKDLPFVWKETKAVAEGMKELVFEAADDCLTALSDSFAKTLQTVYNAKVDCTRFFYFEVYKRFYINYYNQKAWDQKFDTIKDGIKYDFVSNLASVANEPALPKTPRLEEQVRTSVNKLQRILATMPPPDNQQEHTLLSREQLRTFLKEMHPTIWVKIVEGFLDIKNTKDAVCNDALDINEWDLVSYLLETGLTEQRRFCKSLTASCEEKTTAYRQVLDSRITDILERKGIVPNGPAIDDIGALPFKEKPIYIKSNYINSPEIEIKGRKENNHSDSVYKGYKEIVCELEAQEDLKKQFDELTRLENSQRQQDKYLKIAEIMRSISVFSWTKLSHKGGVGHLAKKYEDKWDVGHSDTTSYNGTVGVSTGVGALPKVGLKAGVKVTGSYTTTNVMDDERYYGCLYALKGLDVTVEAKLELTEALSAFAEAGLAGTIGKYAEWGKPEEYVLHQWESKFRKDANIPEYSGHRFDSLIDKHRNESVFAQFLARKNRLSGVDSFWMDVIAGDEVAEIDNLKSNYDETEKKKDGDMQVQLSILTTAVNFEHFEGVDLPGALKKFPHLNWSELKPIVIDGLIALKKAQILSVFRECADEDIEQAKIGCDKNIANARIKKGVAEASTLERQYKFETSLKIDGIENDLVQTELKVEQALKLIFLKGPTAGKQKTVLKGPFDKEQKTVLEQLITDFLEIGGNKKEILFCEPKGVKKTPDEDEICAKKLEQEYSYKSRYVKKQFDIAVSQRRLDFEIAKIEREYDIEIAKLKTKRSNALAEIDTTASKRMLESEGGADNKGEGELAKWDSEVKVKSIYDKVKVKSIHDQKIEDLERDRDILVIRAKKEAAISEGIPVIDFSENNSKGAFKKPVQTNAVCATSTGTTSASITITAATTSTSTSTITPTTTITPTITPTTATTSTTTTTSTTDITPTKTTTLTTGSTQNHAFNAKYISKKNPHLHLNKKTSRRSELADGTKFNGLDSGEVSNDIENSNEKKNFPPKGELALERDFNLFIWERQNGKESFDEKKKKVENDYEIEKKHIETQFNIDILKRKRDCEIAKIERACDVSTNNTNMKFSEQRKGIRENEGSEGVEERLRELERKRNREIADLEYIRDVSINEQGKIFLIGELEIKLGIVGIQDKIAKKDSNKDINLNVEFEYRNKKARIKTEFAIKKLERKRDFDIDQVKRTTAIGVLEKKPESDIQQANTQPSFKKKHENSGEELGDSRVIRFSELDDKDSGKSILEKHAEEPQDQSGRSKKIGELNQEPESKIVKVRTKSLKVWINEKVSELERNCDNSKREELEKLEEITLRTPSFSSQSEITPKSNKAERTSPPQGGGPQPPVFANIASGKSHEINAFDGKAHQEIEIKSNIIASHSVYDGTLEKELANWKPVDKTKPPVTFTNSDVDRNGALFANVKSLKGHAATGLDGLGLSGALAGELTHFKIEVERFTPICQRMADLAKPADERAAIAKVITQEFEKIKRPIIDAWKARITKRKDKKIETENSKGTDKLVQVVTTYNNIDSQVIAIHNDNSPPQLIATHHHVPSEKDRPVSVTQNDAAFAVSSVKKTESSKGTDKLVPVIDTPAEITATHTADSPARFIATHHPVSSKNVMSTSLDEKDHPLSITQNDAAVRDDHFTIDVCLEYMQNDFDAFTALSIKKQRGTDLSTKRPTDAGLSDIEKLTGIGQLLKRYDAKDTEDLIRKMVYFNAYLFTLAKRGPEHKILRLPVNEQPVKRGLRREPSLESLELVAEEMPEEGNQNAYLVHQDETHHFINKKQSKEVTKLGERIKEFEKKLLNPVFKVSEDKWWERVQLKQAVDFEVKDKRGNVTFKARGDNGVVAGGVDLGVGFLDRERGHTNPERDIDYQELTISAGVFFGSNDVMTTLLPDGVDKQIIDGWDDGFDKVEVKKNLLAAVGSYSRHAVLVLRRHKFRQLSKSYKELGLPEPGWTYSYVRLMDNIETKSGLEADLPVLPSVNVTIGASRTHSTTKCVWERFYGNSLNNFTLHYMHERAVRNIKLDGKVDEKSYWNTIESKQLSGLTELFTNVGREQQNTDANATPLLNEIKVRSYEFEHNKKLDPTCFKNFKTATKKFLEATEHFNAFTNVRARKSELRDSVLNGLLTKDELDEQLPLIDNEHAAAKKFFTEQKMTPLDYCLDSLRHFEHTYAAHFTDGKANSDRFSTPEIFINGAYEPVRKPVSKLAKRESSGEVSVSGGNNSSDEPPSGGSGSNPSTPTVEIKPGSDTSNTSPGSNDQSGKEAGKQEGQGVEKTPSSSTEASLGSIPQSVGTQVPEKITGGITGSTRRSGNPSTPTVEIKDGGASNTSPGLNDLSDTEAGKQEGQVVKKTLSQSFDDWDVSNKSSVVLMKKSTSQNDLSPKSSPRKKVEDASNGSSTGNPTQSGEASSHHLATNI